MPVNYAEKTKAPAFFALCFEAIHHLAPHGMASFVLANGTMSSNRYDEVENWLPS